MNNSRFIPTPHLMVRTPSSETLQRCSDAFMSHQSRPLETRSFAAQEAAVQEQVDRFVIAPGGDVQEAALRASRLLLQCCRTPTRHHAFGSSITSAVARRIQTVMPSFMALQDWIEGQASSLGAGGSLADRVETVLMHDKMAFSQVQQSGVAPNSHLDLEGMDAAEESIMRGVRKMVGHLSTAQLGALNLAATCDEEEIQLLLAKPCQLELRQGGERFVARQKTFVPNFALLTQRLERLTSASTSVSADTVKTPVPDRQWETLLSALGGRSIIRETVFGVIDATEQMPIEHQDILFDWLLEEHKPLLQESFVNLNLPALQAYYERPEVRRVEKKQLASIKAAGATWGVAMQQGLENIMNEVSTAGQSCRIDRF